MKTINNFVLGVGFVAILIALAGSGYAIGSGTAISFDLLLCGGAGLGVILFGLLANHSSSGLTF